MSNNDDFLFGDKTVYFKPHSISVLNSAGTVSSSIDRTAEPSTTKHILIDTLLVSKT